MDYFEAHPDEALLETLTELSGEWEDEAITYGYVRNSRKDIEEKRIFIAQENGEIEGFLLARAAELKNRGSIAPDGTPYFEIDELYVRRSMRGRGIGRELFKTAERAATESGLSLLLLSTSTKNYRAILHFYIDEAGMDFWSATLYKHI